MSLGLDRSVVVAGSSEPAVLGEAPAAPGTTLSGRVAAFIALTKPRIAVMVLLTVAVGYLSAGPTAGGLLGLLWAVLGAGLVAGGSSAWNMVLERQTDARMRRTSGRPIPSGRLTPREAAVFGTVLGIAGVLILALGTQPLAAAAAAGTFLLYVLLYTPLKTVTTLNTVVGAVPGALPPVIGWTAATGRFGVEALALFLILFLWQFPHFLAIAWIYREDYARGGLKMLPMVDPDGSMTGRQATAYAMALLPAGLLPAVVGLAGPWYFAAALVLGAYYLAAAFRFWRAVSDTTARRLMGASFLYLPLILLMLLFNSARA